MKKLSIRKVKPLTQGHTVRKGLWLQIKSRSIALSPSVSQTGPWERGFPAPSLLIGCLAPSEPRSLLKHLLALRAKDGKILFWHHIFSFSLIRWPCRFNLSGHYAQFPGWSNHFVFFFFSLPNLSPYIVVTAWKRLLNAERTLHSCVCLYDKDLWRQSYAPHLVYVLVFHLTWIFWHLLQTLPLSFTHHVEPGSKL